MAHIGFTEIICTYNFAGNERGYTKLCDAGLQDTTTT